MALELLSYQHQSNITTTAQASTFSLILLIVLMMVLNFSSIISLFGSGGLLASIILVIVALGAGYLLGGPGASQKMGAVAGRRPTQHRRGDGGCHHELRRGRIGDDHRFFGDHHGHYDATGRRIG